MVGALRRAGRGSAGRRQGKRKSPDGESPHFSFTACSALQGCGNGLALRRKSPQGNRDSVMLLPRKPALFFAARPRSCMLFLLVEFQQRKLTSSPRLKPGDSHGREAHVLARRLVLSAAVLLRRHATLIREELVNSPIHGCPESRLPLAFQRLEASVFMEKLVMPCGIGFPYVILLKLRRC